MKILLLSFFALILGLSSCEKAPDWSQMERDERLIGSWWWFRGETIPSYIFRANGKSKSSAFEGQYYTDRQKQLLYIYEYRTFKTSSRRLTYRYSFSNDTLLLKNVEFGDTTEPSKFIRK